MKNILILKPYIAKKIPVDHTLPEILALNLQMEIPLQSDPLRTVSNWPPRPLENDPLGLRLET